MLGRGLSNLLEELGLSSNDAVFFRDEKNGSIFTFQSETQKKLDQINPDAYFVFNNQPYILFFDLENTVDAERENEIHKQVWSFDHSPLVFITKSTEIQIFNAFSYDKKTSRLQEIKTSVSERNEIFSFWNLQSGITWKWLQETQYKTSIQKKRVNQKLFENIKTVREGLTNSQAHACLSEDNANILILRLIFIRYLIDRDVKIDKEYINGTTILERRQSFSKLIQTPEKLNEFFNFLNEKFNGVLFKNTEIQLSASQSEFLSWVFNGKEEIQSPSLFDGSDFYFDIFDFSIIPVEVISGIYESLINPETRKLHSAVYTPSFLVEYILTETVDKFLYKNEIAECKVFDPSCGSGIFLVQSYRRMVDKEKELNENKVSKKRLREIAENNLFGIDINEQALKVTCFSIYIAILDYQDPKTILDNFQFPSLIGENFFEADFFEMDENHSLNKVIMGIKFEFILGNPPWKKDKSAKHLNWVNSSQTYSKKVTGEIEIAQSFLLRSKVFMDSDTICALIVTSMAFYNVSTTTKEFKKDFLTQFCLDKFFDLSPVRRLVFEEKISPASIVYYRLSNGKDYKNNTVHHSSIKSNIFLKYFKTLIIEKYDQKEIQQRHFLENDWMFKVALYGNTLDFSFLKKLEKTKEKLLDLFDGKSFFKGAGIHKGTKEKFKSFPIIGKEMIENNDVNQYFSKASDKVLVEEDDSYIKSGREIGLYEGAQILIKEQAKNESEIVISLTDKSYVFRSGVFSLSTVNRKSDLNYLYSLLISDLYEYYIFITSGSWGVSTRPQIRLDDEYLSFPYINSTIELRQTLNDNIEKFLSPVKKHFSKFSLGEPYFDKGILKSINLTVENLYDVDSYEKDLMDYALSISRYQFQESKQQKFTRKVDSDIQYLELYAGVFLNEFKSIYKDEYIIAEIYSLNHFIALNFVFVKERPLNNIVVIKGYTDEKAVLMSISNTLSISKLTSSSIPSKNLYIQKDIKGFESNSFYIIKPNELKCWHKAMAWYDFAEIKQAIEIAELNHLKQNSDVS